MKSAWHRNRKIRDAIHRALHEEMRARPEIYCLGEGSKVKFHFDAPQILEEFPDRIITMPISEDANGNFAVGMALAGLVPIVDVISSGFLFRCFDSIANTMAKLGAIRGESPTIVVRAEYFGNDLVASQRVDAIFRLVPGLRVAVPRTPREAYEAMREALAMKAVTLLIEERDIPDDTLEAVA